MKKNILNKLIALSFLFMMATSCDSLLDEERLNSISYEQLGNTEEDATLLVNGCFNALNQLFAGSTLPFLWEQDNDYVTGEAWAMQAMGAGNFTNADVVSSCWESFYLVINRCNIATYKVSQMPIDTNVRKNLLGQVSFLKGWAYFQLGWSWGGIPIYKKGLIAGETYPQPRSTMKETFEYSIEMVKEAEKLLYSPKSPKYETGKISQDAAKALLAKIYIYIASASMPEGEKIRVKGGVTEGKAIVNGKEKVVSLLPQDSLYSKDVVDGLKSFDSKKYYKLARDKAKEIIDSGYFHLLAFDDLWKVGNSNSRERIWNLQAYNASGQWNDITHQFRGRDDQDPSKKQGMDGAWTLLRTHWYELFDSTDYRITKGVLHRLCYYQDWTFFPLKDSVKVNRHQKVSPDLDIYYTGLEIKSSYSDGAILTKFEQNSVRDRDYGDFHYPLIRYADVLLMFAEAENELNGAPTIDALNALNSIRDRSKAKVFPNVAAKEINDKIGFRSAVLEERIKELAMEGSRKCDLMRWGIYLQVMNSIGVAKDAGKMGMDENNVLKRRYTKHLLLPIPLTERNSNNIPNNPGWN